ncbi:allantoate amidohydrolase [Cryobacterium sp. 10I1]|uniref:allantoate amidohydrolase n=1 Tax=Cryobacterium sp. 10I1 TaxID=3048578 RepID=UPI002B23DA50|nr:allantoate amidohydrolase [Cryobacterium sp. 10I1]MEB0307234.1 allantoate amidohydrolase [Cryobacterium sp. 10I1]
MGGRLPAPPRAHGLLSGLDEIADIGRDARRGGYSRHLWQPADLELRDWFTGRAVRLGLDVEIDRNGNTWAWWGPRGDDAIVVGSHLDSVPGGGAYDGPLGVVSALEAIYRLQASGFRPARPCAVLVFAEEEGSRFGIACLGSRLMTGALDAGRARALVDADGISLEAAASAAGIDPAGLGEDRAALARIGLFLELHVEQGRGLIDLDSPVAVASSILAHGRWRITFTGEGNHAGATRMTDRRDPMLAAARSMLAVRDAAVASTGSRATIGRIEAVPGGTNVISSQVTVWLDARAAEDAAAQGLVTEITARVYEAAAAEGCTAFVAEESWSGAVAFDEALRDRLVHSLHGVPTLPTGAGHDAGVLSSRLPTAMIFVRNPTGISHSPEEFATLDDCLAGVAALEQVLRELL